ncbi:hypothetical protein Tco_1438906 [Tanacetum coccineum]
MSSNTSDYIYPIIVPSDFDVEDAFSSTNTPDYTPASPDYSPASPGNTSPDPSDDLSKYLLASLAISPFHDDPYMKVMQAYNATIDIIRMVNSRQGGDQPNIAAIIAKQLQNIIPHIITQVTANVNNAQNANGGGGGGQAK